MPDSPRPGAALAVALFSLVLAAPAGAVPSHDRVERAVVRELEQLRAQAGAAALRPSRRLHRVADAHSRAMARTGRLEHGAFEQRLRGVAVGRAGETIAVMPGDGPGLGRRVVAAWMASPPHRAILTDPAMRRIGVARRSRGQRWFFTADVVERVR